MFLPYEEYLYFHYTTAQIFFMPETAIRYIQIDMEF